MPKVSVIIPNFNNSKYLEESIKSVSNQTLKDIEIIVVDDCSTDNSWNILQKIAKTDSRIKIIRNQENSGAGLSRNAGLDIATGEFIKFLDSDDTMDADVLEYMYNTAKEQNSEIICGYMKNTKQDGSIEKKGPLYYKIYSMLDKKMITPETPGADYAFRVVGIGDSLYSSRLFDNVRFPQLKWEDLATIPIIKYGVGKMFFIDKPVYNYRQHETSTTQTDLNKKTPRILDIVKCFDILRNAMPLQYQEKLDSMECSHIYDRIRSICRWKDCTREHKEKIISALHRIVKIDVPDFFENKFICSSSLLKEIKEERQKESGTSKDISVIISDIKQFTEEPINLSNTDRPMYREIISAYGNFCKNMELLHNSPNSDDIKVIDNGEESTVPRIDIENGLTEELQNFYYTIKPSNDYSDEQKNKILSNLYQACLAMVPNPIDNILLKRDYPAMHSYIRPEFEDLSREECVDIIEDVVHSPEFQKYSMKRMTKDSIKKVTPELVEKFNKFKQSLKNLIER